MIGGTTMLIVAVLVIALWIIIEFSKVKHKIYAIVIIGFILFSYLSVTVAFKDTDTDFTTLTGMASAVDIYFSFLVSASRNMMTLTGNAIDMDWVNASESDIEIPESINEAIDEAKEEFVRARR